MKMSYYFGVVLLLPIVGVSGTSALSQETADKPTMMDEVVVTESRIEESKREVTSNLSVISRETIEQSPSRDLGELLTENGLGHIQK